MGYFVVISENHATPQAIGVHKEAHLKFIDALHDQGKIHTAGGFLDGNGGLYILIADRREDAESIAKEDPYHKAGVRVYKIRDWNKRH